ncbi:hypothetical protein CONCODRAFT_78408 [Conidiobolus coronatus NRRL 28638]|uniref:Uncharacterized protein n=1 Tax=Conidiobolus coronatus (strain ATCC 28846 / CBS 209.66 / NRRL 28638) TaxID=796925 RepID=A0A137P8K9_CONC2|nr:hypothetical protein CONCODRAFT_78408 [Conidiobolus coronatus NRRL 28638]|eukprot:KXN71346.1 hypothetical protein CONCODRAFT_78408 [Conidiobolus coronatus NRRL 28638]
MDRLFSYQNRNEQTHRSNLNDQLQHLINQGAPITEIKDLLTANHHTLQDFTLLPYIIQKMRSILKRVQKEFNNSPEMNHDPNLDKPGDISVQMRIPPKMNFLYGALELADQLYWLVTIENITLDQLVQSIYHQVFQSENSFESGLEKDNLILWWIVQLFYIDYIANNVMPQDFQTNQEIFTKMVALYNTNQVLSKDGCYLRDLALQCAMALQSANIPDRSGLKRRHPTLITAIPYSQMCTAIQSYFNTNFKLKSTNSNIFNKLSVQDLHRISITSLSRKSMVPITMYVSLVPNHYFEFIGAGYLEAKFLKGNSISFEAIDYTNIGAKQELLSLIYSMMLDYTKGPCLPQGRSKDITCVAPNVLDAVFKLVYNAPHSVELILETMLQSFFPQILQSYYQNDQSLKPSAPTLIDIVNFVNQNVQIYAQIAQPNANSVASLLQIFGNPASTELFLPTVWKSVWKTNTFTKEQRDLIRAVLISFGPKYKYDNTSTLIWYVLYNHKDDSPEDTALAYQRISQWIFDFQLISFNHVIFTLACHHTLLTESDQHLTKSRWELTRYLLFTNQEFINRYNYWQSLNINAQIWKEDEFNKKYQQYLDKYPEFFEFENYSYEGKLPSQTPTPNLSPKVQLRLPMYYNNELIRFSQLLESIITGWIENGQVAILIRFLSTFPSIIKLNPFEFDLILDTLNYFESCEWFHSGALKQFCQTLTPIDYPFSKIFSSYIWGDKSGQQGQQVELKDFNRDYFNSCVLRVVDSFDPSNNFLTSTTTQLLPPKQYSEIPNQSLLALKLSQLEILACPLPIDKKIQYLIELIANPGGMEIALVNIKALGLIISGLPFKSYLIPVVNHLVGLLQMGGSEVLKLGPKLEYSGGNGSDFVLNYTIKKLSKEDKDFNWPFLQSQQQVGLTPTIDEFLQTTLLTPINQNFSNFNVNNFSTYQTLMHHILQNLNYFEFNNLIQALNSLQTLIFTDRQLIYIISLLTPLLARIRNDQDLTEMFSVAILGFIDNFVMVNSQLKDLTPGLDLVIGFITYLKFYVLKKGDGSEENEADMRFLKLRGLIQQLELKWSLNGVDNLLVYNTVNLFN